MDRTRRQAVAVTASLGTNTILLRRIIDVHPSGASERVARLELLRTASPFTWSLFSAHDHPTPHPSSPRVSNALAHWSSSTRKFATNRHPRPSAQRWRSSFLTRLWMLSATTLSFRATPYLTIVTRSQSCQSGSGIRDTY